jgi:hypothetical protein
MLNRFDATPAGAIKPGMEIITKDGKRAGYVARVSSGELMSERPARRIPLHWIRRVEATDVYIEPRLAELEGKTEHGHE